MKSKDRMIRAIRDRKDLEPKVISLKKLLASGGMEHYLNLCSDRLADELQGKYWHECMTFVQFGQMPQDRAENFKNFTKTIRNSCTTYKSMPRNGTVDFAPRQDYYNYLAKDSLERMKPFGDESFDTVEQDFPVEYVQVKPTVW